jgi:hypothetical protein
MNNPVFLNILHMVKTEEIPKNNSTMFTTFRRSSADYTQCFKTFPSAGTNALHGQAVAVSFQRIFPKHYKLSKMHTGI